LIRHQNLICEWDTDFLKANIDPNWQGWTQHPSVATIEKEVYRDKSLEECFEMFQKGDELKIKCE